MSGMDSSTNSGTAELRIGVIDFREDLDASRKAENGPRGMGWIATLKSCVPFPPDIVQRHLKPHLTAITRFILSDTPSNPESSLCTGRYLLLQLFCIHPSRFPEICH